jgi:hypothetical protein
MGVLIEWRIVGEYARLAAIDEASGIEAVVFGPAQGARAELERIALRKLERALNAPTPPQPPRGTIA